MKIQASLLRFIYQSFGILNYDQDLLEVYKSEEKIDSEDVEVPSEVDKAELEETFYAESHRFQQDGKSCHVGIQNCHILFFIVTKLYKCLIIQLHSIKISH